MEKEIKYYPVGAFAPGNYENRCCICQARFIGDKRAVNCEPCGTRMEILSLRDLNADLNEKIKKLMKA